MKNWIYDVRSFYAARAGRLVRRLLSVHIREFWPEAKGLRVAGIGYAVPYLSAYVDEAERVFAVMPAAGGAHVWPEGLKNLVCLGHEAQLPLETESVDRILVIHGLEMSEHPDEFLNELWRVLKSNGRILVVIPNRLGLWARAEWTPFGFGEPYTLKQLNRHLQQALFVRERTERALFMPPFRSFLILRTAYVMESFGKFMFSGLAGVHIVEASKQVYAGTKVSPARAGAARRVLVAQPVSSG